MQQDLVTGQSGSELQRDLQSVTAGKALTVIKPTSGWKSMGLAELWDYRELIWFLALRDISARYKQTLVGVGWAVLQPLLAMLVFTVVFGRLAKLPSDGLHYPVFCFSAMLPWQYFSSAVINSSNSISKNVHLLTKVHFPRLTIPVAAMIPPLVDLAAGFLVLFALMLHFDMEISWKILYLPIFLLLAMITALGVGLWLSALAVEFRDLQHVMPFIMQLWMFASPVVYSANMVPLEWRPLFGVNPIAGVIAGFRWAVLGAEGAQRFPMLTVSAVVAVTLLITGVLYFRRVEKTFADVV
jgi:lipopolysaccharide transport system permease protein